jgi:archaellum component FlaD/FlaE
VESWEELWEMKGLKLKEKGLAVKERKFVAFPWLLHFVELINHHKTADIYCGHYSNIGWVMIRLRSRILQHLRRKSGGEHRNLS